MMIKKINFLILIILGIYISNVICSKTILVDKKQYKIYVNGSNESSFPSRGNYLVDVSCENLDAKWDYNEWKLSFQNVNSATDKCNISFSTIESPDYLNTHVKNQSVGTCSNASYTSASTCEANGGTWTTVTTQGKCSAETYTTQIACETDNKYWYNVMNENGYRYEGKNPNNYIWFNNELWRIIGVFDTILADGKTVESLTKIIRADSIGGLTYGTDNAWTTTTNTRGTLNDLLNNYYYKSEDGTNSNGCLGYKAELYIGSYDVRANCNYESTGIKSGYRSMIEEVTWHLGGMSSSDNPAASWYTYERSSTTSSVSAATGVGHIGLMYVSDYGYAVLASSCARTTSLFSYNTAACGGQNWLYGQGTEQTITPDTNYSNGAITVDYSGSVFNSDLSYGYAVRPVLYLSSSVYVVGGDGTAISPYIINM